MGGHGSVVACMLAAALAVLGPCRCCGGSPIVFHVSASSELLQPPTTPPAQGVWQLGSLAEVAEAVKRVQAEDIPRDIVVELGPGAHRVPSGGLQLGREHSSSSKVTWRASAAGTSSIHGGIAITGWRLAADPALPDGVVVAPVPAALKGQRLRHLYVGGVRAHRTRVPAAYLNLTLAPADQGGSTFRVAPAGSCNLTGTWHVGGHNHWATVTEQANGSFTAAAHNVPRGGWTRAHGVALPSGSIFVTFNQGKRTDHATVTGSDCSHIHWADTHHHPSWSRMSGPSPNPGPPSPSPPVSSLGGYYLANSSEPLSAWTNIGDVEFVYSGVASNWAETRCTVANVSAGVRLAVEQSNTGASTAETAETTKIVLKQPCFWNLLNAPWHPIATSPPAFIENVRAHLHERGNFYYDLAKGEILYYPRLAEVVAGNLSSLEAVVAVEEVLLHINGSSRHSFHGINFEYGTWFRPMEGEGFVEAQSGACSVCPIGGLKAHRGKVGQSPWLNNGPFPVMCGGGDVYALTPGNVIITGGKSINFSNCTFQHLGAYATSADGGSQRVSWSQCRFRDISAGALMLGEISDCAETNVSRWNANFSVSDSYVTNLPVEYTGASSIFLGYVDSSTVAHNYIANTSYSGLTVGWGWGRTGCRRGSNRIVGNHVVNPARVRCCDGGALYTLGPQPNSVIELNHVESHGPNISQMTNPGGTRPNAIYHDNGSGGWLDNNNVLEGEFAHYCALGASNGRFGNGASCPGATGEQEDCVTLPSSQRVCCTVDFVDNWMHMPNASSSTPRRNCQGEYSTKHHNKGQWQGGNETGDVFVPAAALLPPRAAAIANAAGPRTTSAITAYTAT